MLDILKSNRILRFLVGVLILLAGAGLIYLALIAESLKNNNSLQYLLLIVGFLIAIFGLFILYKEYWKNEKPDIPIEDKQDTPISNNQDISNYRIFVDNLNIEEIDEISLFVHTGRNSLEILRQKIIADNITHKIDINILLKHPYSETTNRFIQIESCLRTFQNEIRNRNRSSTVDIRYYSGLPYFHAILCKYKNIESYKSYISYYKWEKHRTVACSTGILSDKNNDNELLSVTKSWFEHLFSVKNLHTIVFDLDDTIIDSYDFQIESWVFLLNCIFEDIEGLGKFRDFIKPNITKQTINRDIKSIFLRTTKTEERWNYIFNDISDNDIKKMEKIRFEKRTDLTISKAELFRECRNTLEKLSKEYNLTIISATSEDIVKEILDKHDLNNYFSLYLGKNNETDTLDSVEDKTPYLIKTSNLIGIPFNRMVFIGDSQTDYKAAKQLNINFIAANMVAKRLKQGTFIREHNGLNFNSYEDDTLLKTINKIKVSKSVRKSL